MEEKSESTKKGKQAGRIRIEDQVEILIDRAVEAIEKGETRVTIADLIRLRKLRDRISPKKAALPKVTWVEGWEPVRPASKKKPTTPKAGDDRAA